MSKTIKQETFYKNGDGFVLNQFVKDGVEVILYPKQAKYLLAPLGTELRKTKSAPDKQNDSSVNQNPPISKEKSSNDKQASK